MIEHVDPHQHARRNQPLGQSGVLAARLRIAGRMVVKQHDRRGAAARRLPEDLARMDDAGVEGADRQHGASGARGAWCRAAHAELLDRPVAVLRQQELGDGARARDLRAARRRRARQRAAAQLDRGEDLRRTGRADAANASSARRAPTRARPATPPTAASTALARSSALARALPARARSRRARCRRALPRRGARAFHAADRAARRSSSYTIPAILPGDASSRRRDLRWSSSAACSEPPQKEIDRAQGAIDAARAAGAEQYAHRAVHRRDHRACSRRTKPSNSATTGSRCRAHRRERARAGSRAPGGRRQSPRARRGRNGGQASRHDDPATG